MAEAKGAKAKAKGEGKADARGKEKGKGKEKALKFRERVELTDAAKMLSELAAGVGAGTVRLERGGQKLSLVLPKDIKVDLRAREGLRRDRIATRGRIRIRITWGA